MTTQPTTHAEVLDTQLGETADGRPWCELEVGIPADLVYFAGHFPGDPVLPGVFQLTDLVLTQVETCWPELGRLEQLRRLKFITIIRPGDRVQLRLERRGAAQVTFTIHRGETRCTSGSMTFGAADEGDS